MMRNKQHLITYAYHFLSEAMIVFLIAIPILRYQYNFVPYWGYLIVSIGICLLYTLFYKYSNRYALYIIIAPFIGLLFYLLGYPIFISIVFTIVLTWRSINIRSQQLIDLNRENRYILITFILSFLLYAFVKESEIIMYALLQLMILLVGYVSSHLIVIHKEERKQVGLKLPLYITGILIVGVAVVFPVFNVGRFVIKKIWEGFVFVFIFIAGGIVWLFEFLDPKHNPGSQEDESYLLEGDGQAGDLEADPLIDKVAPYLYWGAVIAIVVILIIIAVRMLNKKFKQPNDDEASDLVSYAQLDGKKQQTKNPFSRFFNTLFNRPIHPARKLIHKFEENMIGTNYERYSFETVDHWSERIGLPTNLEVYQKVRYGNLEVNEQEMTQLKEELETFIAQLTNNN